MKKVKGDGHSVDWEKLAESVQMSVRFLDNVVDANKYVSAVPEIEEAAHRVRRIGLSVMGLADLMYQVGVRYGSAKGQEMASQVMEFIRYHAMTASIDLARCAAHFLELTGVSMIRKMSLTVPKPLVKHVSDFGGHWWTGNNS